MPEINFPIEIYLSEFFDKYGFEDGQQEWIGWQFRATALDILNKHLCSTPIHAEEIDGSSSHNNCQIALFYNDDPRSQRDQQLLDDHPYSEIDTWTDILSNGTFDDLSSQKQEKCRKAAHEIVAALGAAEEEFNDLVLDDFSRLANTPDEDLPLLVGKLKDGNAKKLYERLLKGVSIK